MYTQTRVVSEQVITPDIDSDESRRLRERQATLEHEYAQLKHKLELIGFYLCCVQSDKIFWTIIDGERWMARHERKSKEMHDSLEKSRLDAERKLFKRLQQL